MIGVDRVSSNGTVGSWGSTERRLRESPHGEGAIPTTALGGELAASGQLLLSASGQILMAAERFPRISDIVPSPAGRTMGENTTETFSSIRSIKGPCGSDNGARSALRP